MGLCGEEDMAAGAGGGNPSHPGKFHFPKVPRPPETVPPARVQLFKYVREIIHTQTIT